MSPILQWYLDFIKEELELHQQVKFTGNVEFQVNFKEGSIANLNCGQKKSIRKPE